MLGFTTEQQIVLTIQQGSVFYFVETSWTSAEPHYFIVLNSNPRKDVVIVMVGATTLEVDHFTRVVGYPRETFVDVTPQQCEILKKISMFNCNSVVVGSKETLVEKLEKNQLKKCGYVEKEVLKRLINGVKCSPVVTGDIKKMLN